MAKRFMDTKLWNKSWFRKLPPKIKCAWHYLIMQCDNAGVWDVDYETLSFFVGETITQEELFYHLGSKLWQFTQDKIYIQNFIEFQYCEVSELNPNNNAHLSVIKLLKKYGIFQTLTEGLTRASRGSLDMDKDKDFEKGECEGKKLNADRHSTSQQDIDALLPYWYETQRYLGISPTKPIQYDYLITQAYQRYRRESDNDIKLDDIRQAIIGARFEREKNDFKPKEHLTLERILRPKNFSRFRQLGKTYEENQKRQEQPNVVKGLALESGLFSSNGQTQK